jgi:beta-galactosidase/beta-glucuronidase
MQTPNFDFFNYAGILRPVTVQVLSNVFLRSLNIYNIGKSKDNADKQIQFIFRQV